MQQTMSPEAYYDTLSVLCEAPQSVTPLSIMEMHLYGYLGCILGLFAGSPVSDWGYKFAVTKEGFPFSVEIENARLLAIRRGYIESGHELMTPRADYAVRELDSLTFGHWVERRAWFKTATSCGLALPGGAIRYAINQTPGMSSSLTLRQRKMLLEDGDAEQIYDEYKVISKFLGAGDGGLLSPTVIWLSARVLEPWGATDAV